MQIVCNKPKHWQDFEILCKDIYEVKFKSLDIVMHGRNGQKQDGVDIYGHIENGDKLFGIQCKGKNDYCCQSQITEEEIDAEIEKMLNFTPRLSIFIFATTTQRDARIQGIIRRKDEKIYKKYGIHISISFWNCIEEMLSEHPEIYHSYLYSISITSENSLNPIEPLYFKVKRVYRLPNRNDLQRPESILLGFEPPITDIFHSNPVQNHSLCEIPVVIQNTGHNTIEDYNIEFHFSDDEITELSNLNYGIPFVKRKSNGLYYIEDDNYCLCFKPDDRILVKGDSRVCKLGVIPRHYVKRLTINWELYAREFHNSGVLIIPVNSKYVEKDDEKIVLYPDEQRTELVIEEAEEEIILEGNKYNLLSRTVH